MGNAISSAITDSWMASHERRVKKWLNSATEESVLDALTASFFPGDKGNGGLPAARDARSHIKETFGAYGGIDPVDKKRYWHEKDLGHFLNNRFSGPELNISIPILWRCFHFYAYFPFPQKPQRLDYGAFQRAIGFLAAEGNLRLGENADGITMDADTCPDDSARASKHLWGLFRSLSTSPSDLDRHKLMKSNAVDLSSTEEDVIEVLALTQPDNPCIMPAPIEELRPHAKRILSSSTPYDFSSIPLEDFFSLLKLMLSVQLDKPEWSSHEPYFHSGRVLKHTNPDILHGAAGAILRSSTSSEKRDIDWQLFKNILSVHVPDFLSQFRLIFTSFLTPITPTEQAISPPTEISTIPVPYVQYLNLFLHPPIAHPKRHVFEEFGRQEAHLALQTTQAAYSAPHSTLNTIDLIAALGPIKTGTLLLITGEAIPTNAQSPSRVIVGACMPTPWDIERQRAFRASPPQKLHRYTPDHMLFQLEPRHEISRPEPDAWIMDLIYIKDSDPESGTKGGLRFGAEGASGLSVDFDTGIATFRIITSSPGDGNLFNRDEGPRNPTSSYHTISSPTNERQPAKDRSTSLMVQKLEIYDLGGHATEPFEEQLAQKPQLRTASPEPYRLQIIKGGAAPLPKHSEPGVGEDVLRARIEGFGSSRR